MNISADCTYTNIIINLAIIFVSNDNQFLFKRTSTGSEELVFHQKKRKKTA